MSGGDSDKNVPWADLSSFILKHFAKATQNTQVRGKFMWSGAWVEYIKESYDIPDGYDFTSADLNKAIRFDKMKFAVGIENVDVPNAHGVYRDCITQVHPMTGTGSRTKQIYYIAVEPGTKRPDTGGKAWFDDVWISAPRPAKKGALTATDLPVAPGTSASSNSKRRKAKQQSSTGRAPGRPVLKRPKDTGSSKRKSTGDTQMQQRSLGGQYGNGDGNKKARTGASTPMELDSILKEASGMDDLLFSVDDEGVITKTFAYTAGDDNKSIVVVVQQQLNSAAASTNHSNFASSSSASQSQTIATPPKDNHIEWTSAKELQESLDDRSGGLSKEEMDVLRVLTRNHIETEGKTKPSKVILPKGQGQTQETVYIKQPPIRVDSQKDRSLNEVASISKEISDSVGVDLEDVIDRIATYYVEGNYVRPAHDDAEQLLHQSTAFLTEANLSLNQYHLIRMYVAIVWKLKIGAPVMYMRDYMSKLCPKDSSHISQEYLETGTNKKYQYCTYWYDKTPRDGVAGKILSLLVGNKLVKGTEISTRLTDGELAVALNVDKGSDRTTVMLRVLHEVGGNKGESSIVIGEMGDGANECYDNLLKCFFSSDTHIVKQFLQNIVDDELHLLIFEVEGDAEAGAEAGKKTKCCAIIRRDHGHANIALPESIAIVDVEGEEYLSSSIDTPDLEPNSEIVLLRRDGKAAAVAAKKNGTITAWTSLCNADEACVAGNASVAVEAKSLIGLVSVDGKMGSAMEGHQGQSCVGPCNGCTALSADMTKGQDYERHPRTGQYSNPNLYKKYEEAMVMTFESESHRTEYLKKHCYGIRWPELLRCTSKAGVDKRTYGAMHCFQGNFGHIDQLLFDELTEIDKGSEIQAKASEIEEHVTTLIESAESEKAEGEKVLEQLKLALRGAQNAADHNLTVDGNRMDRDAARARTTARRNLQSAKKNVADAEERQRDINQYICDLKLGQKDTEAYIARRTTRKADLRKKRTLAALVLDDCYFKVCGLTPRKYWGGRTYVFRDALCLMENWDKIATEFSAAMVRITGGRHNSYVDKCKAAMAKATAVMKHLYPAAVMSKSQKKLNDEKKREFKNLCINIGKEVRKQYPKKNVWWKLHTTETHIWMVAEYWGFLGIASEEGFESAHVILNRIDSVLGQTKNKERKVQAHKMRIGVRQDANTTKYRNEFKDGGKKIVNRKKPAIANGEEGEEVGALDQYDILPIVDGREPIVKCRWCRRRCPKSTIQFHIMASHMCSNVSLAALGEDLPEAEPDVEAADVQPQAESQQ